MGVTARRSRNQIRSTCLRVAASTKAGETRNSKQIEEPVRKTAQENAKELNVINTE
jgi:hypothetical protein